MESEEEFHSFWVLDNLPGLFLGSFFFVYFEMFVVVEIVSPCRLFNHHTIYSLKA